MRWRWVPLSRRSWLSSWLGIRGRHFGEKAQDAALLLQYKFIVWWSGWKLGGIIWRSHDGVVWLRRQGWWSYFIEDEVKSLPKTTKGQVGSLVLRDSPSLSLVTQIVIVDETYEDKSIQFYLILCKVSSHISCLQKRNSWTCEIYPDPAPASPSWCDPPSPSFSTFQFLEAT